MKSGLRLTIARDTGVRVKERMVHTQGSLRQTDRKVPSAWFAKQMDPSNLKTKQKTGQLVLKVDRILMMKDYQLTI